MLKLDARAPTIAIALLLAACKPKGETTSADEPAPVAPIERENSSANAPTPAQLCEHIAKIVGTELSSDELAEAMQRCTTTVEQERLRIGEVEYARQAGCAMASKTQVDLDACDNASGPERDREVCQHLLDVLETESIAAGQEPLGPEVTTELINSCIEDIAKDRVELGEEEVARTMSCVLAAERVADLEACDSN